MEKIKNIMQMLLQKIPAGTRYYATVGMFPLTGLAIVQLMRWLNNNDIDHSSEGILWFSAPVIYLISLPIGFLFWLHALRREREFPLVPSIALCLISMAAFIAGTGFYSNDDKAYAVIFTALGCIAGCFVFINAGDFFRTARKNRIQSAVALIAMSCSAVYSLITFYMWKQICHSVAAVTHGLLLLLGVPTNMKIEGDLMDVKITISSKNFGVQLYEPCSGLEGMFLFTFLLSVVLLIDWRIFKKLPFTELYLMGFIYMYAINVLRIVSLFMLGHVTNIEDPGPFIYSLRGLSIHLFHSVVGQVYYFFAFMVFAHFLYRYATKIPRETV